MATLVSMFTCLNATEAQSVERKCYKGDVELAKLKEELQAENQQPFMIGKLVSEGLRQIFFFSDPLGKNGYVIESNTRSGSNEKPTQMCVNTKYRTVRMNNASLPGIPAWALIGGSSDKAEVYSRYFDDTFWATHDDSICHYDRMGERVAFAAMTVSKDKTGAEADGDLFMVSLNEKANEGDITFSRGNGFRRRVDRLRYLYYTEYGVKFLSKEIGSRIPTEKSCRGMDYAKYGEFRRVQSAEGKAKREWEGRTVTVGGVSMTGKQWDNFAACVKNAACKDNFVKHLMKENGWSRQRAEAALDK